jgi:hypothetical protein
MTDEQTPNLGALAASLAKAQNTFPTIVRDRKVTVTTKAGGSYSFMYAPLDTVLAAVRAPLAANGLAIVQILDGPALVTTLLHESGASLSGRVDLPPTQDVQGLGSAITYLRRYALQAMLGIAAEDDDDGNRASGNQVVAADVERGTDGSLIGIAQVGDKASSDYLLRQTPAGSALGFRLRGDKGGILVEAAGPLAEQLHKHRDAVIGKRVTVWGTVAPRTFTPKGGKAVTYQVLAADRVRIPDIGDLPVQDAPQAEAEPVAAPDATTEEDAAREADLDALLWG